MKVLLVNRAFERKPAIQNLPEVRDKQLELHEHSATLNSSFFVILSLRDQSSQHTKISHCQLLSRVFQEGT